MIKSLNKTRFILEKKTSSFLQSFQRKCHFLTTSITFLIKRNGFKITVGHVHSIYSLAGVEIHFIIRSRLTRSPRGISKCQEEFLVRIGFIQLKSVTYFRCCLEKTFTNCSRYPFEMIFFLVTSQNFLQSRICSWLIIEFLFNVHHKHYVCNIILPDNPCPTYNEVISFVISDRKLDSFQLNEVHRHSTVVGNNTAMMDRISNHSYQPIRHPNAREEVLLSKMSNPSFLTSGQLSKLSDERIDFNDRRSLNVFKSD